MTITPKFKQIVAAGTGDYIEVFGLTESGDVYVWDGKCWNKLKNKGDV